VKLRGRTEVLDRAEGAQFLSARGAKQIAHHGPLQRLLDSMLQLLLELSQCTSVLWQPGFTKLPAEAYCYRKVRVCACKRCDSWKGAAEVCLEQVFDYAGGYCGSNIRVGMTPPESRKLPDLVGV